MRIDIDHDLFEGLSLLERHPMRHNPSGDRLETPTTFLGPEKEVHLMTILDQAASQIGTDKAASARDQNALHVDQGRLWIPSGQGDERVPQLRGR